MLLAQPMVSAKECNQTAQKDLKKYLEAAPGACQEHLRHYYCQLIQDSQSFNTCANLTDEQGLQYFECIARPIQGQQSLREPFTSQCPLDKPVSSGKGLKASKRMSSFKLEVPAADLRIAFLIVAHRAVENVQRLLQRIYSSSHFYLIHVDRKSPIVKAQLDSYLESFQQAQTFSEVDVTKGSSDLLRVSMLGLRRLLKLPPWQYFVKLSEFDYPVAPLQALQHYLWLHKGLNLVGLDACSASTCSRHLGTSCAGATYSFVSMLRMHKPLSFGMRFARGSEWVALTVEFAKYLATEIEKPSSAMREVWDDALLLYQPDETFFQTAILNSPFCQRHMNMILHHVPAVQERRTHGAHDEIGTRSPADFSQLDLALLLDARQHSQPRFFARKFPNMTEQPAVELCRQLDNIMHERAYDMSKRPWQGLQSWLAGNFTKWARLAGLTEDLACPVDGSGTDTCTENGHVQLVGRLGATKPTMAPTVSSMWSPETWVLRVAGESSVALLERFAVPAVPSGSLRPPPWSMMGVSLLAARVGTGWIAERGEFEGHVNVVPLTSCSARDVQLAIYWAPHVPNLEADIQVMVEWLAPDGQYCGQVNAQLVGCPVRVSLPRACARTARPGTWTTKMHLQDLKNKIPAKRALAFREFIVYSNFTDVSVLQMQRFFELRSIRKSEWDAKDLLQKVAT